MICEECISELTNMVDHIVNVERDIQEHSPSTTQIIRWALDAIESAEESGCLPTGTAIYMKSLFKTLEDLVKSRCWDTAYHYLRDIIRDYFTNQYRPPIMHAAQLYRGGD